MFEELKNIIKGEMSSDEKELSVYSHDASIFEVRPQLVIKPRDVEDIKNLIKWTADKKNFEPSLSLTARSGGSDMTGGALSDSVILDFTAHFNRILEVGAGSATVEPGVFYRDFEKETLKKDLLLPSYPASREICTIGGMVANNSGGEKSLRYGKTEDYVEELNVVLSDGEEYVLKPLTLEELEQKKSQDNFEGNIYRQMSDLLESNYELIQRAKPDVSKNSAGYALWSIYWSDQYNKKRFDLTKLFVGSQGTLGLITKIKFRLIKPKKHSKLLIIFLQDLKYLGEVVNLVNKSGPESFESYDDHTFKLAAKILPDLIKKIGIMAMFKFIPDVWAILTGGTPKMVMIVEFTGDKEGELTDKIKKCRKEVFDRFGVKTRITKSDADAQKYWTIRRESFNLLRKHVKGKKTVPFIDDVIVRPEYLPEFLPKLNAILDQYKNYMIYTIAGHPGDGNFHIIPLMDLSDDKSRQIIPELAEKVYNLVLEYRGSITAEHNDGLIRTPYLEKMYGPEIYRLFEQTKKIFDPKNIFNPRKKVGLDIKYVAEHIKHG
ncbi:MAG: FAD-binding oxidoreductase [Candidatus Yanofskybacteria bacterium]|nr:FAD-binding oxidoreductase [Candidatus Yanofskybacteria bacterium]